MNIFFLHENPVGAAQAYANVHVVKIITELNQMMVNGYSKQTPYKKVYTNHPMTKWITECSGNWEWAFAHLEALLCEYAYRYGKTHKGVELYAFFKDNAPDLVPHGVITDPPRCFGDYASRVGKTSDVVHDYQQYYIVAKRHLWKYKVREKPEFIKQYESKAFNFNNNNNN